MRKHAKQEANKPLNNKIKKCVYCAEEIKNDAKKCPYCEENVESSKGVWIVVVLVFAVCLLATALGTYVYLGNDEDSCQNSIPHSLSKILVERFPRNRLPHINDIAKELYQLSVVEEGNKCPLVASADVNGDGVVDWAVILKSKSDNSCVLVAAISKAAGWETEILSRWGADDGAYVFEIHAGHYERTGVLEGEKPKENEVIEITTKNSGFISGSYEASSVVYFFDNGHWLHVWTSD